MQFDYIQLTYIIYKSFLLLYIKKQYIENNVF